MKWCTKNILVEFNKIKLIYKNKNQILDLKNMEDKIFNSLILSILEKESILKNVNIEVDDSDNFSRKNEILNAKNGLDLLNYKNSLDTILLIDKRIEEIKELNSKNHFKMN
ncbi:hypothetical protein [Mycoplasma sp. CSL10166]|uniref:hypothetical protein n=1 Tax=Mycoplasma sp. CSL10166 TaxID=2813825 RepID=UPI00197BC799|nr:hypothetical protein [Mycoplasma sp. CSL10166]MBN4084641.1 hypothetical protein [Mycoplasma sp. CSL10166]